ncbi:DHA2 family efflux MFS transporter permease subunit [Ktedonosporobacter rubrisoli]|uniref:DHA2 family efflux MFS transporter permease subunit n=1 Tax=Ktedonosporobacter rubrisoli TaxID=2509675 RepID=A0A4P6JZX4_KTERU|nr:DHA2 family efflux MFS transporter permease subunit [Ktedonosporobacter rubrisoli]QBD80930.1 DHA2 family efflux MFS transporter permease subunit [Ktedonosporobacter rubrisoli]
MQMTAPATQPKEGGISYKWIVAFVVIFGLFMTILDSTIVNIAIPRLQTAFGANLNDVQWVLTGYTLAQGVATPLTGFLADRIGTKRLYLISLGIFTAGSAVCGLAWNLPILIFFRVLQAMGGAFMSPLAITLLYREFPVNERGTAMGFLGIPILLAPAFGPTLGGYFVTFADWQFIFYINVPIGILAIVLGMLLLREAVINARAQFDIPGFIFSATGLAALLYALSDASTDGWGSVKVLGFMVTGILLLAIFVIIEIRVAHAGGQPLLDLRVFANAPFTTSSIASTLVTFALFGGLFLIPIYLQNLRGLNAFQAGLLLLPQAFASMVAMLAGGRLVDKIGVRAVVIPGLILLAIVSWLYTSITLTMAFGAFQLLLILRSLALGLCAQPLSVSALSEIPPRQLAQASSVSTTLRFVASSLGTAVLATLVQSQTKVHYTHLAERVTPDSALGQLIPQLQAAFVSHGASLTQAYGTAIASIYGMLQKQAYLLAMHDAFLLCAALAIAATIAAIFVRYRRTPPAPSNSEEAAEAQQAREEAMLAV